MTPKNIPIFYTQLDRDAPEIGIDFVALVDRPAIEKAFMKFKANVPVAFAPVAQTERRIISGPLMLADVPIYRNDADFGEYYIVFQKDILEKVVQKFFRMGFQNNVNLMHDNGQQVQGLTMYESFISDQSRGISPMKGYEDAPEGTWFGSFIVDNDDVWEQCKNGSFTGFSIEGLLQMSRPKEAFWTEIDALLKEAGY